MNFNSISYMIFLPTVVVLYFLFPARIRWLWLLLTSYYFYMSWSPKYAIIMMVSTLITYFTGILISKSNGIKDERLKRQRKKLWVTLSLVSNLAILFFFKYFNFVNQSIDEVLGRVGVTWSVPDFNVLLPVGISFYTFQALSYTIDVYRGDLTAEKHFGKYALFVSFFPQLVAGPIEKAKDLLPQFSLIQKYNHRLFRSGLLLILWGLFKKVVIADRLAILVNTVYNDPSSYEGITLVLATIFFGFQIYCDFSSYSDIAIGSARIMGYSLSRNFDRPYFSKSIQEFWRRWHISLSGWFKEYLYIPLGGNRVNKVKKYRNVMIVFLTSGLWHGASWNFVIWGFLHGMYQVIGSETKIFRNKLVHYLQINRGSYSHQFFKGLFTFSLVTFAWIFFRANSLHDSVYIIQNIFYLNPWVLTDGSLYQLGLDELELRLSLVCLVFLVLAEWLSKDKDVIGAFHQQHIVFRWFIYYALILAIIIFGSYGASYSPQQFIYFQF